MFVNRPGVFPRFALRSVGRPAYFANRRALSVGRRARTAGRRAFSPGRPLCSADRRPRTVGRRACAVTRRSRNSIMRQRTATIPTLFSLLPSLHTTNPIRLSSLRVLRAGSERSARQRAERRTCFDRRGSVRGRGGRSLREGKFPRRAVSFRSIDSQPSAWPSNKARRIVTHRAAFLETVS